MSTYQTSHESIPTNHILAVLGENGAIATRRELEQQGFSAVSLFTGEDASVELNAKGDHSGPIGKVLKKVNEHLSEEPNYLAQYEEESRQGNVVLAVHVEDREQVEHLRQAS